MSFAAPHRRSGALRAISISHLSQNVQEHYVLSALTRIWELRGLKISVDAGFDEDVDLFLLHHDRTTLDVRAPPKALSNR